MVRRRKKSFIVVAVDEGEQAVDDPHPAVFASACDSKRRKEEVVSDI